MIYGVFMKSKMNNKNSSLFSCQSYIFGMYVLMIGICLVYIVKAEIVMRQISCIREVDYIADGVVDSGEFSDWFCRN